LFNNSTSFARGEREWGQGAELAEKIGLDYGTLRNYGSVSRSVDLLLLATTICLSITTVSLLLYRPTSSANGSRAPRKKTGHQTNYGEPQLRAATG
jgi:hypothetical protein